MSNELKFGFTLATKIWEAANTNEVNTLFQNDDFKIVFELSKDSTMILFRRVDIRNKIGDTTEIVKLGNTVNSIYAAINIESIFIQEWVTYFEHRI